MVCVYGPHHAGILITDGRVAEAEAAQMPNAQTGLGSPFSEYWVSGARPHRRHFRTVTPDRLTSTPFTTSTQPPASNALDARIRIVEPLAGDLGCA